VIGTVTEVAPVVTALARSMEKIHRDRGIAIDIEAQNDTRFRGERQDLEEMVGNLVDNACKWAQSRVAIEVLAARAEAPQAGNTLRLVVDDDGPGLTPSQREQVQARRGNRLDETKPGTGLGLSIVVDLAALYGGALTLGTAPIGGLRAELVLPAARLCPNRSGTLEVSCFAHPIQGDHARTEPPCRERCRLPPSFSARS
jgi:signal transduction histidine kinase